MPLSEAHWPCLLPPNAGEVHARGAGEPGAGQKVFCPGTAAEQSKHEGLIWSVHGKCWSATLESGKEREEMNTERAKTPELFFLFFLGTAVCQGWGEPRSMSMQYCTQALCVRACVRAIALGGTNSERGSQTGQLTADSGGELHRWKSLSHRSPLFQ